LRPAALAFLYDLSRRLDQLAQLPLVLRLPDLLGLSVQSVLGGHQPGLSRLLVPVCPVALYALLHRLHPDYPAVLVRPVVLAILFGLECLASLYGLSRRSDQSVLSVLEGRLPGPSDLLGLSGLGVHQPGLLDLSRPECLAIPAALSLQSYPDYPANLVCPVALVTLSSPDCPASPCGLLGRSLQTHPVCLAYLALPQDRLRLLGQPDLSAQSPPLLRLPDLSDLLGLSVLGGHPPGLLDRLDRQNLGHLAFPYAQSVQLGQLGLLLLVLRLPDLLGLSARSGQEGHQPNLLLRLVPECLAIPVNPLTLSLQSNLSRPARPAYLAFPLDRSRPAYLAFPCVLSLQSNQLLRSRLARPAHPALPQGRSRPADLALPCVLSRQSNQLLRSRPARLAYPALPQGLSLRSYPARLAYPALPQGLSLRSRPARLAYPALPQGRLLQ